MDDAMAVDEVEVPARDSGYTDVHRGFLQTIANFGALKKNEALEILPIIMGKEMNTPETVAEKLNEIIEQINENIRPKKQAIIEVHYENFNVDYIVFMNIGLDPINKLQNAFSMTERNFFASLLKNIALEPHHSINIVFAINLSSETSDKSLKKRRAEELIDKWISLGYFASQKDSEKIYLGPKGIAEFGTNLKELYPDEIKKCEICEDVIFYGLSCSDENEECTAIFHRKCVIVRLRRFNDCPSCKMLWKTVL